MAGYLNVSRWIIDKLVKTGRLQVVYLDNRLPRFLLSDVDAFIAKHRRSRLIWQSGWDAESAEVPVPVILKLTGLTRKGYESAQHRGEFKDRTYATVRRFMAKQIRREVTTPVQQLYKGRVDALKRRVKVLEQRLVALQCASCNKKLVCVRH